jgi:hypothetical protein
MTHHVRVKTNKQRYAWNEHTGVGVLVTPGTPGTVTDMDLIRHGNAAPTPYLTVAWDVAIRQYDTNDESDTIDAWEEARVRPADLEFAGVAAEESKP